MPMTQANTKKIYIIEDDIAAASLIREMLELEGEDSWSVQVITNGATAVATIEAQPPDLVLLDLRLPDADGGTIFRHIRHTPAMLHMPILFITGATAHELHKRGIDDGILLRKPVNLAVLLHVIRAHLHAA